ncbi:cytochrome P450 [Cyathus striatus]|nr:cytochrome P450 [Cyathus striatus]
MPLNLLVVDIAASIAGAVTVYLYLRSLAHYRKCLDVASEFPAKGYADMCKKYNSDIIHLNAFGTDIIVLNSYSVAQELLEKRSSIYSSSGGYPYLFVAMTNNALWRTHRQLFSKYFHPRNTEIHQPRETEHVHILLGKLLESPEKFMSHLRHTVGAIALSEVYGLKIKSEDDPYIDISENALKTIVEMVTPGAFLVETFPLLKHIPEWFPGTRFHQAAKKAREDSEQVLNVPYNASLDDTFYLEGSIDMHNRRNVDPSQHVQTLKEVGVMTYLGAMDTTNAALGVFILTMMLFPEAQRTAQKELDKVLGGRLPDHSDITSIPYITALLWEVLRWETPFPTGFPHYSTEDDIFNGYTSLKNLSSFQTRDYPDPHNFSPERFLKDGKINDAVKNPEDIAFGFGSHLAKSSMWLTMASILSTFDIQKPVDKDGNVFEPTYKFGGGGVNHVEPFECSIKPRSEKAVLLINAMSLDMPVN